MKKSVGLRFYDLGITKNESGTFIEEPFVMNRTGDDQADLSTADAPILLRSLSELKKSPEMNAGYWGMPDVAPVIIVDHLYVYQLKDSGKWESVSDSTELTDTILNNCSIAYAQVFVTNENGDESWTGYNSRQFWIKGLPDEADPTMAPFHYFVTTTPNNAAVRTPLTVKMNAEVFLVPGLTAFHINPQTSGLSADTRAKRSWRNWPNLKEQPAFMYGGSFLTTAEYLAFANFYIAKAGVQSGSSLSSIIAYITANSETGQSNPEGLRSDNTTRLASIVYQDNTFYYCWEKWLAL